MMTAGISFPFKWGKQYMNSDRTNSVVHVLDGNKFNLVSDTDKTSSRWYTNPRHLFSKLLGLEHYVFSYKKKETRIHILSFIWHWTWFFAYLHGQSHNRMVYEQNGNAWQDVAKRAAADLEASKQKLNMTDTFRELDWFVMILLQVGRRSVVDRGRPL